MLCKIKPSSTGKIENFIEMSLLFIREFYSDILKEEDILSMLKFNQNKVILDEIKRKIYNHYLIKYENEDIGILSTKENEDIANISQFFILKKFRNKKLSYKILEELKMILKEKDCKTLRITIPENNKKLEKIIQKLQFKKCETVARYMGDNIYIYENEFLQSI